MPLNIPNTLTWARIALIPIFVGVFYLPDPWLGAAARNLIATSIFVVAAVTDWFDGYLARSLGQTSAFGAFLDPVADKLMVAAALILLVQLGRADAVIAVIIIGREITISALREWMAKVGKSASVAVAYVGKLKTAAQMTAIPMLLFNAPLLGLNMRVLGEWLIYVAAALTLWSMGYYLHRAMPLLRMHDDAGGGAAG
ncbi:CDP-diacylglycerol--glycerol-3-phosphate 3-phosphatidyltransferase [Pseudothauera nasutitermitis]|uniref:CDP-diacylglycerol--glycerol-3-phosphate 3-phosphatidyltransferase n=1 Tax=Pseudothauera nasutitermitis TaxID=2565930 RepID=A0A4S4B3J4_9RHOO|nr:CDP-diacylglycerol--glycerol-3-phosphate 3-phosphatidyltransferase [Pseudothauera nasutitermitis]THF67189.1 CDP-diacylglycerol--glycerol-3-phosphate 3-phosphatidyltransferase [Pseudothauera nasutitermitis]